MAEYSQAGTAFLERMRKALAQDSPERANVPSRGEAQKARNPFLEAAAVLDVFTYETLKPVRKAEFGPHSRDVFAASVSAPGFLFSGGRTLKRSVRLRWLSGMDLADVRQALAANPDRLMTSTQAKFERLLNGESLSPLGMTQTDLIELREAQVWARELGIEVFQDAELDHAMNYAAAVASFEHLRNENFIGRDEDTAQLLRFFGMRGDGRLHVENDGPDRDAPRAMFIEGVGGIGKTALIGHVLNDYRADDEGPKFPFAYLACDDPGFNILDPEIMLSEAADQLARHVRLAMEFGVRPADTDYSEAATRFRAAQMKSNDEALLTKGRTTVYSSQESRLGARRDSLGRLLAAFGRMADATSKALKRTGLRAPPVVLLIDTFEEVQGRPEVLIEPFRNALREIMEHSRNVRVLIAGRSPLTRYDLGVPDEFIKLEELTPDAARMLVKQEVGHESAVPDDIVQQIGGNPLNLRLAARVLKDSGIVSDLKGPGVSQEMIRGFLYQRILDHIKDDRVRRLAHPGMVLRRVTPEVISKVLAEAFGIEVKSISDAEDLFAALRQEHTLVRIAADGSLRYREDVRGPVLRLLRADQPEMCERAHRAAIAHYMPRDDAVSRAEYIYHTLMLDDRIEHLHSAWSPDLEEFFVNAIEELPDRGKVWLAQRSQIELDEEVGERANIGEWERIVGPRILSLLESAGPDAALELLAEREGRTLESPLIAIEARALMSKGDYEAAIRLLDGHLYEYPINGNPGRRAEWTWLLAVAQMHIPSSDRGRAALERLEAQCAGLKGSISLVQALAARADLVTEWNEERAVITDALAKALASCTDGELSGESDLARYAFARLPIEKAAHLPRIALVALSGMYEAVPDRETFRPVAAGVGKIADLMARHADKGGSAMRELAAEGRQLIQSDPLETSDILQLISLMRRPLTQGEDMDPALRQLAAQTTWCLAQMETVSLDASTLAGLQPYRDMWEREASAEVLR